MLNDAAPIQASAPRSDKHIVDVLIEERAPRLSSGPFWPVLRPPLYSVLNYQKAVYLADSIQPMRGRAAMDFIAAMLQLHVEATGTERLPRAGSFIALCNHPTGITDGIAAYDLVRPLRPDVMFYANSDAHRVCDGFHDNLIPVEWVLNKRTRERTRLTLKMTEQAVGEGRPIVIFAAGRLARIRPDGRLTDPEWMPTAVSLAKRYKLPVVPIHVAGPYAFWFHMFDKFSAELRDITLFHELLNKQGKTYRLTVGPLIAHETLGESVSTTRRIKHYVERVLCDMPDAAYDPDGPECTWRDPPQAETFKQG
jgi:putative hemolysin